MRIAFIGAGAMGSIVGGRLAAGGSDVTLIDKWREHIDAINACGLIITDDKGERKLRPRALTEPPARERFDLVVILVKSAQTRAAAETARSILSDRGVVISFQNGIGNEEAIADVVSYSRTLGGTLYFGGNVVAPGKVRLSNPRATVAIGPLDLAGREAASELNAELLRAGFESRVEDDVLALKWQKALVNIGANALATIRNEPNRLAGNDRNVRAAMIGICAEAIKVAKAKGIRLLGGEDPEAYVRQATDVHSYEHRSSMSIDLAVGRKTEVDVTNGAIEKFGDETGVETPLNTLVVCAINRIEREKGALSA